MKLLVLTIALTMFRVTGNTSDWKKYGNTIWRADQNPGTSYSFGYGGVPKSAFLKSDKCGVIRVPSKKVPESIEPIFAEGPLTIAGQSFQNLPLDSNFNYRCLKQGSKYVATLTTENQFYSVVPSGLSSDSKSILVSGYGIVANQSHKASWFTVARRSLKANSCGIVIARSTLTYNHSLIKFIDDDEIATLPSKPLPRCKNGVIVP
jgi:hypothetical protein